MSWKNDETFWIRKIVLLSTMLVILIVLQFPKWPVANVSEPTSVTSTRSEEDILQAVRDVSSKTCAVTSHDPMDPCYASEVSIIQEMFGVQGPLEPYDHAVRNVFIKALRLEMIDAGIMVKKYRTPVSENYLKSLMLHGRDVWGFRMEELTPSAREIVERERQFPKKIV